MKYIMKVSIIDSQVKANRFINLCDDHTFKYTVQVLNRNLLHTTLKKILCDNFMIFLG